MLQARRNSRSTQSLQTISRHVGAKVLFNLCAGFLFLSLIPVASAQTCACVSGEPKFAALPAEAATSELNLASLPSVASIGAKTDITVFLQPGVPKQLQLAALRQTWTTDPAIRDFKGLVENDYDWDFDGPNSVPGFGPLGPEIDVNRMIARMTDTPARVASLTRFGFRPASN
jgi:hypothetical protein